MDHVVAKHGVSERLACRVLGQHRSTQRKVPTIPNDEAALIACIIALATQYGRYGYRRIAAMLRDAGWVVNVKRVERIWRREGLKVPQKQPKRGRLWLNDGSCIRLRPEYAVRLGTDPLRPIYAWSGANTETPQKFVLDLRGRQPSAAGLQPSGSQVLAATNSGAP